MAVRTHTHQNSPPCPQLDNDPPPFPSFIVVAVVGGFVFGLVWCSPAFRRPLFISSSVFIFLCTVGWDDKSCSKIKTPCACQLPATNSSFTPECGTDTGAVCGWSQPCCREDGLCGSSDEFCNADCLSSFSFQSACGTDETAAPTVTPAPTIASECPSGWREYQGYCWNITTESYPWNQCDEACAPGWPACILDEDVNLWLADLAFTQRVSAAWIGATDAATEGVWEWTASCPYVSTFTAWSPNEPNNVGIGGEQDCAVIWSLFYGGTQHISHCPCP